LITEKRSYAWFEKRRRTEGLDIAHEQMIKAVETVSWLHRAVKSFSERDMSAVEQDIEHLFKTEEQVDRLRTEVFKELSKGTALIADYREDLLHLVKRLDTVADHAKDAARCLKMLTGAQIPKALCEKVVSMSASLVECAQALQESIEKISVNPADAMNSAEKVGKIEHEIDEEYLGTKALFIKYGTQINYGSIVIFDDLIEFVEQAADLCADTADYVIVLASRE
jgi:predicted phosphate transport protein (TIGR00153 family)